MNVKQVPVLIKIGSAGIPGLRVFDIVGKGLSDLFVYFVLS